VGTVCFGEKRAGYPPLAKRLVGRKGYSPLSHNKQEEAAIADDLCHILVPPGGLAALPAATLDGSAPDGAPPGMRPPIEQPSLIARVFHRPLDGETPGF